MILSLPLREHGLKFYKMRGDGKDDLVAPFAGVWIEIGLHLRGCDQGVVAPLVGARIEISSSHRE
jgi:hypothetical protein